jgi:hypothetical protein
MPRNFDPLADKIMCDHCRNKYPFSPYYFPEYKPYVTEAEVERVRMESRADYIDPAKKAAECFENYRERDCKVPAAKLSETTTQLCPPAPARPLRVTVGSLVQLNTAGLDVESDYDWSADPLTPGLNGTITHCAWGYATIKSSDSSRKVSTYAVTDLEPARDVAVCMLSSVIHAVCSNFGERD